MRKILSIPLSFYTHHDKLIWHFDRKGLYTVKTAYHVAYRLLRYGGGGADVLWKQIWKLNVSPKVRDFMWHMGRNVLPTRDNLSKRGVTTSLHCLFCQESENGDHVLVKCSIAQEVWRQAGFLFANINLSFQELFIHIISSKGQQHAELMATVAWSLWAARNAMLWSNVWSNPWQISHTARLLLDDRTLASSQAATAITHAAYAPAQPAHIEHPANWLAYVDGTVFRATDFVGFGLAIEDAEGHFSLAISGFQEGGDDPLIVEALALRQCLLYVSVSLLDPGCIFTDCQSLYLSLNSMSEDSFNFGLIVSDYKTLLLTRPDITVFWIRRTENECTHLLARNSIRHSRFQLWVNIPDVLIEFYSQL
ncbi:uncharacterized protein LOC119369320 [Jatropha curcas]|uniref:uncharacterized protein LOC119369320 n=1 Tax=Jatropha curcas TaxID=180498 RepID=UPI0018953A40|nr:uncharacterized protein LOC119369320 [Jatropha curcas]